MSRFSLSMMRLHQQIRLIGARQTLRQAQTMTVSYSDTTNRRWVRIRTRGPLVLVIGFIIRQNAPAPNTPVLTNAKYSAQRPSCLLSYSNGGAFVNSEVTSFDLAVLRDNSREWYELPRWCIIHHRKTIPGNDKRKRINDRSPQLEKIRLSGSVRLLIR